MKPSARRRTYRSINIAGRVAFRGGCGDGEGARQRGGGRDIVHEATVSRVRAAGGRTEHRGKSDRRRDAGSWPQHALIGVGHRRRHVRPPSALAARASATRRTYALGPSRPSETPPRATRNKCGGCRRSPFLRENQSLHSRAFRRCRCVSANQCDGRGGEPPPASVVARRGVRDPRPARRRRGGFRVPPRLEERGGTRRAGRVVSLESRGRSRVGCRAGAESRVADA